MSSNYGFQGVKFEVFANNSIFYDDMNLILCGFLVCDSFEYKKVLRINMLMEQSDRDFSQVIRRIDGNMFICKSARSKIIFDDSEYTICCYINSVDSVDENWRLTLETFLITEALGRIFRNLGYGPLHASCIQKNESAYIFMGHPGIGKTTSALQMLRYGYTLVSDDRPWVDMQGNVYRFQRPVNLSKDVVELFRSEYSHLKDIDLIRYEKYRKLRINPDVFPLYKEEQGLKIHKILIFRKVDNMKGFIVNKLSKVKAIQSLMEINYPYYAAEEGEYLFDLCNSLVNKCDIYELGVEWSQEWIEKLLEFIEK